MKRILAILLVLWLAPAWAQTQTPQPTPTMVPEPAAFLWQVKGTHTTHYLLGSIHLLPASAQPPPARIDAAYDATQRLVLETDPDALASADVQQRFLSAAHREASNAAQQFGPQLAQQLKAQAQQTGLPSTVCDAYRAWFCALTLEIIAFQRAGFEAQYGVDQHYYNRGVDDDKEFIFLESTEQHLALFTEMTPVDGRALLTQTLDGLAGGPDSAAKEMLAAWTSDNTTTIDTELATLRQRAPTVYARLMRDRNQAWMPRLGAVFGGEVPTLVIVGAAHLSGPEGLLATLRRAGWLLTPVPAAEATEASTTAGPGTAPKLP